MNGCLALGADIDYEKSFYLLTIFTNWETFIKKDNRVKELFFLLLLFVEQTMLKILKKSVGVNISSVCMIIIYINQIIKLKKRRKKKRITEI